MMAPPCAMLRAQGLAIFVMLACNAYATLPREPGVVLSIWAKSADKSWVGTGFIVSEDGQFVTCYHVIRGARTLTVYRGKESYGEVQVIAIAPAHDLALLKIANLPTPAPYLRLSD